MDQAAYIAVLILAPFILWVLGQRRYVVPRPLPRIVDRPAVWVGPGVHVGDAIKARDQVANLGHPIGPVKSVRGTFDRGMPGIHLRYNSHMDYASAEPGFDVELSRDHKVGTIRLHGDPGHLAMLHAMMRLYGYESVERIGHVMNLDAEVRGPDTTGLEGP